MVLRSRRTVMPRKNYKPEEIVAKLRQVDVLTSQGQSVAEAVRSIGVSEVTYYRWRQEFGGLKSGQVKRLMDFFDPAMDMTGLISAAREFPDLIAMLIDPIV